MVTITQELRAANLFQHYSGIGASSKRFWIKIPKNLMSNNRRTSCPEEKPTCPYPKEKQCVPPKKPKPKSPQVFYCNPDCRPGKQQLPPRGCLPWEKAVELCPNKMTREKFENLACDHLCKPYIGQGLVEKSQISRCEHRRIIKCLEATRNPEKCVNLEPTLIPANKVYPMRHASRKAYLPGKPITLPRPAFRKSNIENNKCLID